MGQRTYAGFDEEDNRQRPMIGHSGHRLSIVESCWFTVRGSACNREAIGHSQLLVVTGRKCIDRRQDKRTEMLHVSLARRARPTSSTEQRSTLPSSAALRCYQPLWKLERFDVARGTCPDYSLITTRSSDSWRYARKATPVLRLSYHHEPNDTLLAGGAVEVEASTIITVLFISQYLYVPFIAT